jgi:hypothetical protein
MSWNPNTIAKQMQTVYTDMAATFVKLAVRFYPMQPKRMQECREALHCVINQSPCHVPYLVRDTRTSIMHKMNSVLPETTLGV